MQSKIVLPFFQQAENKFKKIDRKGTFVKVQLTHSTKTAR
jgi:hypothetical protein